MNINNENFFSKFKNTFITYIWNLCVDSISNPTPIFVLWKRSTPCTVVWAEFGPFQHSGWKVGSELLRGFLSGIWGMASRMWGRVRFIPTWQHSAVLCHMVWIEDMTTSCSARPWCDLRSVIHINSCYKLTVDY